MFCKWQAIKIKIEKVFSKSVTPTENVLSTFNTKPLSVENGIQNSATNPTTKKDFSILFIGNSITRHGAVKEENDDARIRGLTSTSREKDYVHVLLKMISQKYPDYNIHYSITNMSGFETDFAKDGFDIETSTVAWLKDCEALSFENNKYPDLVIFQFGENMSFSDVRIDNGKELYSNYSKLIRLFPSSIKIVMLPFWPEIGFDQKKINVITDVAVDNDCFVVDISHLGNGTDKSNLASSYKNYKQPGVGAHPGDVGMNRIAQNIFSVINNILQN